MKRFQITLLSCAILASVGALLFYSFLFYKYYKIEKDEKKISAYYESRTIRSSYISGIGTLPAVNTFGDSINNRFEPFVRIQLPSGMNFGNTLDNKYKFHALDNINFTINELALMNKVGLLKKFELNLFTKSLDVPQELVAWSNESGEINGVYSEVVRDKCAILLICSIINILIFGWVFLKMQSALQTDLYSEDYILVRSDSIDKSWLWFRRLLSILINTCLFLGCVLAIFTPTFFYLKLFDLHYMPPTNYLFELNFTVIILAVLSSIFYFVFSMIWWVIRKK